MQPKALIIGATSSLGFALCHEMALAGWELYLAARDTGELDRLKNDLVIRYQAEVTNIKVDFTETPFDAQAFVNKAGYVDAAFMIAGDMGNGDSNDPSNISHIIDVNFTVPATILTVIAQQMEEVDKGNIIVISSVAGDRGRQSNYPYGSAKAGLTAFSSGLRNRLSNTKVHVMTVKPGFIDTPMTYGMDSPLIASRQSVAKTILKAMKKRKDILYVPFFWSTIMLIIKHIPERIFKKLRL